MIKILIILMFLTFSAYGGDTAVHKKAVCDESRQNYAKSSADRYWLDNLDPKMASMSPEAREDWVIDYVLTTYVRDKWEEAVKQDCVNF